LSLSLLFRRRGRSGVAALQPLHCFEIGRAGCLYAGEHSICPWRLLGLGRAKLWLDVAQHGWVGSIGFRSGVRRVRVLVIRCCCAAFARLPISIVIPIFAWGCDPEPFSVSGFGGWLVLLCLALHCGRQLFSRLHTLVAVDSDKGRSSLDRMCLLGKGIDKHLSRIEPYRTRVNETRAQKKRWLFRSNEHPPHERI
jgi:hypothetical protein